MFIVELLVWLLFIVLAMVTVTQIVIPSLKGTKLFPFFKREADLKEQIVTLEQKISEQDLVHHIKDLESKLEKDETNAGK